jgi:hypothetical protein
MRRLLLSIPLLLLPSWCLHNAAHAQPYYPYPGYYPPAYYPPSYYRPPPPPPPYYAPPPYRGGAPYYYGPANNPNNCGTPDQPKPCYR